MLVVAFLKHILKYLNALNTELPTRKWKINTWSDTKRV